MPLFNPDRRYPKALAPCTLFGDQRIRNRYEALYTDIVSSGHSVIHRLSRLESSETGYYRLMANDRFSIPELISSICQDQSVELSGRHVLVIGDSTELNLESQWDHFKDVDTNSYLSDNKTRGIHSHVSMALDADSLWGLGLCDLQFWTRPKAKPKSKGKHKDLPQAEKESNKWFLGVEGSQTIVSPAARITYVFDREADIVGLFDYISSQGSDFVIRSGQDRRLAQPDKRMSQALAEQPVSQTIPLKVRAENALVSGPPCLCEP